MAIFQTLRPDLDVKKVGVLLSTGTNAAALVDDGGNVPDYTGADDTTYIRAAAGTQYPNAYYQTHLNDLNALAANQRIKQLRVRARLRMHTAVAGDAAIVHVKLTDPQSGLGIMPVGTSVESTGIDKFEVGSATVVSRTGAWHPKPPPLDLDEWSRSMVNRLRLDLAWYYGNYGSENLRVTELYVDVDVRSRPTVGSVTATGQDATTRPTITWAYTPNADGDPQIAFQVKVFSSTQYGATGFNVDNSLATWNSGTRFGVGEQAPVGTDLANGGVYKAYVRSAQDFNGSRWWSDWSVSSAFTVGLAPPPAPTLTVTSDATVPNLRNMLQFTATLNALAFDDADLEGSAGNWGAVNATVARSTAQARHGAASLAVTATGGTIPFAITDGNGGVGSIAARPGLQFTGTGYVRAQSTTRAWRMVLRWTDATNTYLSQSNGASVTDSSSAWTQLPAVTGTAPAGAVHLYAQVEAITNAGASEVHYFDQFQIVPGASSPAWAPGFLATSYAVIEAAVATTDPRNLAGRQLYGGGDDTRDASGFYTTGTTSVVTFDMLDRVRGLGSIRWEVEDTTSKLYFGWPSTTLADPSPVYALAAVPGRTYTFSVYARTTGSSFSSQLNLQAIDATGATVGSPTNGGVVTIGTAGWARYVATITAPAGAVYVRPHLDNTASVTGRKVWVDGAQWELGTVVTDLTRPGGQALDWVPVRGFTVGKTPVPGGTQSLATFDHEVPPGHTVIYRAWIFAFDPASGQPLSSPLTAYVPTLIDPPGSGQWVLSEVSPAPFLRGKVSVLGGRTYTQPEDATVYHPLRPRPPGQVGQRPVVLSDWIGGRDGSLQLASLSDDDFWLLERLLERQDPLWLAESQGGGRYIRLTDRTWTETRFRNKCVNLADGAVLQANEYEYVLNLGYVNAERPPDNEPAVLIEAVGAAAGVAPAGVGVIFTVGDQINAEQTQALYTTSDSPIRGVAHWYNDRTQIDNGGGLGTGWGSGWINGADTTFQGHYALGECIEAVVWLADVDAYATQPQFYNTDLPYVLSNIYLGHGPNYGECYVVLFSELDTYDDGQPRYAERLRMSYLNAIASIRGMTLPGGAKVRVGLGFGGYNWTPTTIDLSFWEPCIQASDFTCSQFMQHAGDWALLATQLEHGVAQLGSYGKPVAVSHFELWGQDAQADPGWTAFVSNYLANDAWMNARKSDGLFFWNFMQEPNVNNTANEPTWTNAIAAMRRHRATNTAFTQWRADPAAPTTPPTIDASSPAAVRTGVQTTRTTASFTPPAGSVVAAFVANNAAAGVQRTHTLSDSAGGTWIQRGIIGDNSGTDAPGVRSQAEVWVRKQAATGAAMTVTDALDTGEGGALIVKVLTSCNPLNPVGEVASASGTNTAAGLTLKAIDPNSLVIGAVSEWNVLAVGTPGTGCTVSDGAAGPNITSYILRRTAATGAAGNVTLSTTAPTTGTEWNCVAAEFRGV